MDTGDVRPVEARAPMPVPGLLLEDLGDEVIAYDPETTLAHVLSPAAAALLLLCDGRRGPRELAALASELSDEPVPLTTVEASLSALRQVGVLGPGPAA